jgi:hypothetical protein
MRLLGVGCLSKNQRGIGWRGVGDGCYWDKHCRVGKQKSLRALRLGRRLSLHRVARRSVQRFVRGIGECPGESRETERPVQARDGLSSGWTLRLGWTRRRSGWDVNGWTWGQAGRRVGEGWQMLRQQRLSGGGKSHYVCGEGEEQPLRPPETAPGQTGYCLSRPPSLPRLEAPAAFPPAVHCSKPAKRAAAVGLRARATGAEAIAALFAFAMTSCSCSESLVM